MKKLVSVLLMLALVCGGAAAMAEIPGKLTSFDGLKFRTRIGNGSCRVETEGIHNGHHYTASYYLGGGLECYNYDFDCGCTVTFSPDGVINYDSVKHNFDDSSYNWNAKEEAWIKYSGPDKEITDRKTDHKFDADAHKAPVAVDETDDIPPMQIENFAAMKAKVETFAQQLDSIDKDVVAQAAGGNVKLISRDGMYALYERENENAKYRLVEVYMGKYFFNDYWNEKDCRMQGNSSYGTYTEGFYDWNTGKLYQYKFYAKDRSVNAVYTDKNVLTSYETWDDKGAWWGYFDNEWYYAANGDPNDEENTIKKDPPAEILEKILHAPAPATYESACVTSESQLKADQKGVPFIIGSKSDINNATVQTVAEQTGARSTEFDISLVNASGKKVDLAADSVTLTLGYPAGMPQEVSKNYEFAVVHKTADGTEEVMTTMTGDVKLTANGPQVTATGFSPYTVIWGTADELAEYAKKAAANAGAAVGAQNMPQTGDDSMILLWAALLGVSCMALVLRKRSRA